MQKLHPYITIAKRTDLLKVDDWFPEFILCLVEVSHSNLAKVARMVFVDICSVMMLTTCHTATTRMLSMFAYTTMASGDMAATE